MLPLFVLDDLAKEFSLEGKGQYDWPPLTNKLKSAPSDEANMIWFFSKQATLTRRSTVPRFPNLLVFPGFP